MTVTFFGHKDAPQEILPVLKEVLTDLIERDGADHFYVGNQGAFDQMVLVTLRQLKQCYPHIDYAVMLAYLPQKPNDLSACEGDPTVFPEVLDRVPKRYAISRRNTHMAEIADTVVTYVVRSFGGAAQFKALAEKKGKRTVNLPELV